MEALDNILRECFRSGNLLGGKIVHLHLLKCVTDGSLLLWNRLLNLYCHYGDICNARYMFESMPYRDTVSYNTTISAFVRVGYNVDALYLYSNMKCNGALPDNITLSKLISASTSLVSSQTFHAHTIRYGVDSDKYTGSSLVESYAKYMRLEDAFKAFKGIAVLDLVSCNVMINACTMNRSKDGAVSVFHLMLEVGLGFDGFTLSSVVKSCAGGNDLRRGMQFQCYAMKSGFSYEVPFYNSLITMYIKCQKGMSAPVKVFSSVMSRNIITWTAMISGFVQNGQIKEAVRFYEEMLRLGVVENDFSFSSILSLCTNLANLEQGKKIHCRIAKSMFSQDLSVNNTLMDMYFKCGSLDDACLVFSRMGKHDVISFTTMIIGFGEHGNARDALKFFAQLENEGLEPDHLVFLGCLHACSHCGLVNEGIEVLKVMIKAYNIMPRIEHFSCAVDMLGRAGRLHEAVEFITEMGLQSNVLVWETFFGACVLHGDAEFVEKVSKKFNELHPLARTSVTLANMYANHEVWDIKERLREKLSFSMLKKESAHSWFAVC